MHVFQAFPFLEQAQQAFLSARVFAREFLGPQDLNDKKSFKLQAGAEERLADEINANTMRVVQGDGTASISRKDDVRPIWKKRSTVFDEDVEIVTVDVVDVEADAAGVTQEEAEPETDADTDGDVASSASTDDEPSWMTPLATTPLTSPEANDRAPSTQVQDNNLARHDPTHSPPSSRSRALSHAINASWNPFTPFVYRAPLQHAHTRPPSPILPAAGLRRVHSRPHLPRKTLDGPAALHALHPPSREYRLPATSLTSSPTFAPRPAIRRAHSSHPDITSLCDQWASKGPANTTVTYKPDILGGSGTGALAIRRRKHSSSVSSISGGLGGK